MSQMHQSFFRSATSQVAVMIHYERDNVHYVYLRLAENEPFYSLNIAYKRRVVTDLGDEVRHEVPCRGRHSDKEFNLVYLFEANALTWCGEEFVKDNSLEETARYHRIEYLCGNDEMMILVTIPRSSDADYSNDYRVYVGNSDGGHMEQATVFPPSFRLRDGGTTAIHTDRGGFYAPSPLKSGEKPAWSGQELEYLDALDFVIDEGPSGVSITRR